MYWLYNPSDTTSESKEDFKNRLDFILENALDKAKVHAFTYIIAMRRPHGYAQENDYPAVQQYLPESEAPGFEPKILRSILDLYNNIIIKALDDFVSKTPIDMSTAAAYEIEKIICECRTHQAKVLSEFVQDPIALARYSESSAMSWAEWTPEKIKERYLTLPFKLESVSDQTTNRVYNTLELHDSIVYKSLDKHLAKAMRTLDEIESKSAFAKISRERCASNPGPQYKRRFGHTRQLASSQ